MNEKAPEKKVIKPKPKFRSREDGLLAHAREEYGDIKTHKAPEDFEYILNIPNLEKEISDEQDRIHEKVAEKSQNEFSGIFDLNEIADKKNNIASKLRAKATEKISENAENAENINIELQKHLDIISEQASKAEDAILSGADEDDFVEVKIPTQKTEQEQKEEKEKEAQKQQQEYQDNFEKETEKIETSDITAGQFGIENKDDLKNQQEQYDTDLEEVKEQRDREQEERKAKEHREKTYAGKGIPKIDLKSVKWPVENSRALKSLEKTMESLPQGFSLDTDSKQKKEWKKKIQKQNKNNSKRWGDKSSAEITEAQENSEKEQNFPEKKFLRSAIEKVVDLDRNNKDSVDDLQKISENVMTSNLSKEDKEKYWKRTKIQRRIIDPEHNPQWESYKKAAKRLEKEKMLREGKEKISTWKDSKIAKFSWGVIKAAPVVAAAGVAAYAALKFLGPFYGWYKFVFKPEWDKANKKGKK